MALQIILKMLNAHSPVIVLHSVLGAELPECTSSLELASLSQFGFPTAKIFHKKFYIFTFMPTNFKTFEIEFGATTQTTWD